MADDDVTRQLHRKIDEIDLHMETVGQVVQVLEKFRERVETHQSQTQDLVGVASDAVAELRTLGESSRVSAGSIDAIRELLSSSVRFFELEVTRVGEQSKEWESAARRVLDELDATRSSFVESTSEATADLADQTRVQRGLFEDAIRQAQRPLEEMEKQLNRARHDLKDTIERIQPTVQQAMEDIKPLIVQVAEPAIAEMEGAFRGLEAEGRRIHEQVSQLLQKVEAEVVGGLTASLRELLGTADRLSGEVSGIVEPALESFRDLLLNAATEVRQSSQESLLSLAQIRPAQEAVVSDLRREVDELRRYLSQSQDFERVALSLAANLELTERINELLEERKPSLATRIELALFALVFGGLIGSVLGGLSMLNAALVALPASAVALWSEPIVGRLTGARGSGGHGGRGRTN